jgi:hypothetical protein
VRFRTRRIRVHHLSMNKLYKGLSPVSATSNGLKKPRPFSGRDEPWDIESLKVSWFLENTNVEQKRVNKDLSFLTHSFRFTASVILVTDISINLEEACTCANPATGGSGELGKNVISASLPVITCSCTSGVSQANGNIAAPPTS